MPVTALNWIIPISILLCGAGLVSIRFLGFVATRWGYALCCLGAGYALMLFETDRFTPIKQIIEDDLILLSIIQAGRALNDRLSIQRHFAFELLILAACTSLILISRSLLNSVRLETFFVQSCCSIALWVYFIPFSKRAHRQADKILSATFFLLATLLTLQSILYLTAPHMRHSTGAWRSSIWGDLIQYTGLVGSIILTFAVMLSTAFDAIERYRVHANTDPLTNLLNRRGLKMLLASREGKQVEAGSTVIILADIDHFKSINDHFGHAFGDDVIARFASLLLAQSATGGYPVRLGGEEFVLLLPGALPDDAIRTAEKIRRTFQMERWSQLDEDASFTASFGVTATRTGESIAAAIERADHLLYAAKRSGRNRIIGDDGLSADAETQGLFTSERQPWATA